MHDALTRIEKLEKALAQRDADIAQRDADIARLTGEVKRLSELLDLLKEKLGENSSNSSKPPSSDGGSAIRNARKRARKGRKTGRKRGGQKGHQGHRRALLPESEVDQFVNRYPEQCENCWESLPKVPDPYAKRHQVTELPPIKPHTTEYRRHKVQCPCCGHRSRAPENTVPKSAFGPRLTSILALLTGVYHLSRRQAQQAAADLLGVTISLGALSNLEARVTGAIRPGVDEVWAQVRNAPVKHTDGTGWWQSGMAMQLWTIATVAATVFKIVVDGSKATLKPLFGTLKGVLNSDRAKALNFWAMKQRQICWAHLLRKFVSFSERDGPAGSYGRRLLEYTSIIFAYWQSTKDGKLSRQAFSHRMGPLRRQFEALLQEAASAGLARLSGSCADILAHRAALWTFVDRCDVEPTNNHGERELRAFVLWRKRSFGTQSARGNEFAESIMTFRNTARKQRKNVLALLTQCCEASEAGTAPPSLFASQTI